MSCTLETNISHAHGTDVHSTGSFMCGLFVGHPEMLTYPTAAQRWLQHLPALSHLYNKTSEFSLLLYACQGRCCQCCEGPAVLCEPQRFSVSLAQGRSAGSGESQGRTLHAWLPNLCFCLPSSMQQGKMFFFIGITMAVIQGGYARRIKPGNEIRAVKRVKKNSIFLFLSSPQIWYVNLQSEVQRRVAGVYNCICPIKRNFCLIYPAKGLLKTDWALTFLTKLWNIRVLSYDMSNNILETLTSSYLMQ